MPLLFLFNKTTKHNSIFRGGPEPKERMEEELKQVLDKQEQGQEKKEECRLDKRRLHVSLKYTPCQLRQLYKRIYHLFDTDIHSSPGR